MKSQVLALATLGPLAAFALPTRCGTPPVITTWITVTSTAAQPSSLVSNYTTSIESSSLAVSTTASLDLTSLTTFSVVPTESQATSVVTESDTIVPTTTAASTSIVTSETETVVPTTVAAPTSVVTSDVVTSVPSSTVTPTATIATVSQAVSNSLSEATQVAFKVAATEQCGDNDILSLPGMPWVVANSMYNADQMVGSQCTNFDAILQATDGTKEVQWTSVTDIELVDSTKDLCKGYTNIGIGTNLNKKLSAISSIPAYFKWDRTNTTEFRGTNLFDFITAPTAGDHDSTATSEFMLWVRIWGGQVPIGYVDGPVATFDLFGASWKLYEGQNPNNGVTVRSMLVDENFEGEFQGDLKEWIDAMVQKGYVSDSDYLTVGNAGTEVFYGSAVMSATVALNIEV